MQGWRYEKNYIKKWFLQKMSILRSKTPENCVKKGICSTSVCDYKNNIIDWKNRKFELEKICDKFRKMMTHLMFYFQVVVEKIVDLLNYLKNGESVVDCNMGTT